METIQLFLNDRLVSITANPNLIEQLRQDDSFLSDYIVKAIKSGQFAFLNESDLDNLTVKRVVVAKIAPKVLSTSKPVWYRKGKPSEDDTNATAMLLELRGSEKYAPRFEDKKTVRNKLWEEIAAELRSAGYEVDSTKCQQKFLNMTKSYVRYVRRTQNGGETDLRPPDFFPVLDRILSLKIQTLLNQERACATANAFIINNTVVGEVGDSDSEQELQLPPLKKFKFISQLDQPETDNLDIGNLTVEHINVDSLGNQDVSSSVQDKEINNDNSSMEKIYRILEERTELMRQRNLQREKLLNIFEKLADKLI